MAKALPNAVLDATLDAIAGATRITVCSGEPADYAGIAAVMLADGVVSSGDFSVGDGSPSGRTLTVSARSDLDVDASGTATHVALDDGSALLAVTTVAPQALTAGNTVTIGSWTVTLSDPS